MRDGLRRERERNGTQRGAAVFKGRRALQLGPVCPGEEERRTMLSHGRPVPPSKSNNRDRKNVGQGASSGGSLYLMVVGSPATGWQRGPGAIPLSLDLAGPDCDDLTTPARIGKNRTVPRQLCPIPDTEFAGWERTSVT